MRSKSRSEVNNAGSELKNLLCNHSLSRVGSRIVAGSAQINTAAM